MKLGGNGVLPFRLGGGKAPHEIAYAALYSAVGEGGRGQPGSMIEAWRFARARALAAVNMDRRASLQAFPHTATVGLVSFEQRLVLTYDLDASEQDRRANATRRWAETESAIRADTLAALKEIDARFTVLATDFDATIDSTAGRAFEDYDPGDGQASGPAYATGLSGTQYPNYSGTYVLHVLLDIGTGTPTPDDLRKLRLATDLLNRKLPAWMDFVLGSDSGGFILDEDLLDVTMFG